MPDGPYSAKKYYVGEIASQYTAARTQTPSALRKWNAEAAAVKSLLERLPYGSFIADLPCGDGRFAALLSRCGMTWIGLDISPDMLSQIDVQASDGHCRGRIQGDAERVPIRDGALDYGLCARFLNLIPLAAVSSSLIELRRIATKGAILEVRLARERPIDPWLRRLRRGKALARRFVTWRGSSNERTDAGRDPIHVHPESEFAAVLREAGWKESERLEVLPRRLRLRPDPLLFLFVVPCD